MRLLFLLLLTSGLSLQTLTAQPDTVLASPDTTLEDTLSLFQSLYHPVDDFIEMTLQTDTRLLIRKKYKEEYQPAQLQYTDRSGQTFSYNIKLRSRGNMRKKACYYPPVKLNFKKSELEANGMLRGSDKIKLVLQCRNSSADEAYLLKEYLIYKLYNHFTPYSYQVQLLKINMEDSNKDKSQLLHAFLIEPDEDLEKRSQGQFIDRETGSSYMLERGPYKWMSAFQYMIGNTDWSPRNVHNLKFIKVPEYDKLIPIPYDFDYAGLVGTDYAIPSEVYPIENVQQRYYVGFSYTEEETEALIERLKTMEPELLECCRRLTALDEKSRDEVLHYLKQFIDLMDHPRAVHSALQDN